MTKVETKANLLNPEYYSQIKPNTFNLCIPYESDKSKKTIVEKFGIVFNGMKHTQFDLKHEIDGDKFIAFQI